MEIYCINTNMKNTDGDQHQVWIDNNLAFIHTAEPESKGLLDPKPGDQMFMWVNEKGLAAIGCVQKTWDRDSHTDCMIRIKPAAQNENKFEHRLKVDWYLLLAKPIRYKEMRDEHQIPLVIAQTIHHIDKHRDKALEFVVRQFTQRTLRYSAW